MSEHKQANEGARLRAREATTRPSAEEGSRSEAKGARAPARRLRGIQK